MKISIKKTLLILTTISSLGVLQITTNEVTENTPAVKAIKTVRSLDTEVQVAIDAVKIAAQRLIVLVSKAVNRAKARELSVMVITAKTEIIAALVRIRDVTNAADTANKESLSVALEELDAVMLIAVEAIVNIGLEKEKEKIEEEEEAEEGLTAAADAIYVVIMAVEEMLDV